MKRHLTVFKTKQSGVSRNLLFTLALMVTVCGMSSSLKAQSYSLPVNIPFAFHANNATMAAGRYVAKKPSNTEIHYLVSPDGRPFVVAIFSYLHDSSPRPRLVFNRYGNEYFLSEIWNGEGTGTKLRQTAAEISLKESATANHHAEEVTVLMGDPFFPKAGG
jgi:hypothetical protein